MDDLEILLYVDETQPVTVGDLIIKIKTDEDLTMDDFIAKCGDDFAGRLRSLVEGGLLDRSYSGGRYAYSLTIKGKKKTEAALS
jgi:hypothetical protein